MTTPTTSDLLKYADLQMAAEAFLVDPGTGAVKPNLRQALIDGNTHASRFTSVQATRFLEYWEVVAQQENTKTGFSGTVFKCRIDDPVTGAMAGETVMSFRSTEFLDDAARDNQATNTYEIADTGFAWGQLRDMETWYAQLLQQGKLVEGQFSLTGYSLGGHLASAFNEMHPTAVRQVVTFNGAGIGAVDPDKRLSALLARFTDLSKPNADGSSKFSFTHPVIAGAFARTRASGGVMSDADKNALNALIVNAHAEGTPPADVSDAQTLLKAAERVTKIRDEIGRLGGITPEVAQVSADAVDQCSIDYQLAVLEVSKSTNATGLLQGLIQTYGDKVVHWEFVNQFDVVGDTTPSAVANSQHHVGQDVRVFIEDQPLYRGGVVGTALVESLKNGGIKLLTSNWDRKDFGDTHSLVLLQDSLAVQATVLGMLPADQRGAAAATIAQALADASNRRRGNGDAIDGRDQGKADGDALEKVVNALAVLTLGPEKAVDYHLTGLTDGNVSGVRSCLLPPSDLNQPHVPPSAHRVSRRLLPRHLAGGSAGGDLWR